MGKVILAVLCLIPLVLCVGARSPPATPASALFGEIQNLANILVQKITSWKDEVSSKTAFEVHALYPNYRTVLISFYDNLLETIERIMGFLREVLLQGSASRSRKPREARVRYDVETPTEKLSVESAAVFPPSYRGKPREDHNQRRTGPIHAIPGFHFPEYSDIPDTSFDCSSQAYIPGIYADTETGCQVFHVCWPHKKESFLCPIGTTFNQAILACDNWYTSDCALAPSYYDANVQTDWIELSKLESVVDLLGKENSESVVDTDVFRKLRDLDLTYVSKMLPVKAKVAVFRNTKYTDSKGVETSIDEEKAQEDVDVTEVLAEPPENMDTELPLNFQPREPSFESDGEDTTELPLLIVPRRPRNGSEGVELGSTKIPLTLRSREPRAESDGDELEDTTELPPRVVPRKPRTISDRVELSTTKLPSTSRSREPRADVAFGDSTKPPFLATLGKPRARQEMRSPFAVIDDALGLVQHILRDTEVYYMVSDEKSQPPNVRMPTSANPRLKVRKPEVLGTM